MPESKNRLIPALNEATDSSRHMPAGSRHAVGGRATNNVMQGYALYGEALYPPLTHSIRGASPQRKTNLSGYCSDGTYGPGYAADDAGTNDNLAAA
jgi:hypothetical protein